MDAVPYDFIDRVFTKMDSSKITDSLHKRAIFQSRLWNEVVRVYSEKSGKFKASVVLAEDGLMQYHIYKPRLWTVPKWEFIAFSIDQFLQMDHRFNRITSFAFMAGTPPYDPLRPELLDFPADRLAELAEIVSRFRLESFAYCNELNVENCVLEEFSKHKLDCEKLMFSYSREAADFAKEQLLLNENLRKLSLGDEWPLEFKETALAFVCRPERTLSSSNTRFFDIQDVKQIVAHCVKSGDSSKRVCVAVKSDQVLSDALDSWMNRPYDDEKAKSYDVMGERVKVIVTCKNRQLTIGIDKK